MLDLDDLIRYENENTGLEFKAVQYLKPMHEELIKDLMSMANANYAGDRYIIVGMKHQTDGSRKFWAVNEGEFVDSATYHQLIKQNIEPEIHFEYFPHHFESYLLGVFRIYGCDDQPYMMRKDFGTLKVGEGYIRKGTHRTRLTRPDLDRIWEKRQNTFTASIAIGFERPGAPKEIRIPANSGANRPGIPF